MNIAARIRADYPSLNAAQREIIGHLDGMARLKLLDRLLFPSLGERYATDVIARRLGVDAREIAMPVDHVT